MPCLTGTQPLYHTSPALTALTAANPCTFISLHHHHTTYWGSSRFPPIQQAVACAFSSAALTACSSVPHVTPLSPYHIHRRLNRVSSILWTSLKSCFCIVSFGMERKVHTALHLSPTLGRNSDRGCASLGRDRRKSERGEGNFIQREKQWL